MLQPGMGVGVGRDQQQETQNRLESGLRPVFKIENLQPGTQFRAVVFAKVRNYSQHHQLLGQCGNKIKSMSCDYIWTVPCIARSF